MDDTQTSRDEDFSPGCSSVHQKRSEPDPSCVSMRSDRSMGHIVNFKSGDTQTDLSSVHQKRSEPESSCVSMRSDESMGHKIHFPSGDTQTDLSHEVPNRFRSNLKKKFECLYEGTAQQGNPTLLNEIYTELYITESESGEISNEHEVRQIETQSRRAATEDTPIQCNDIFRPLPGQDKPIRTVLTKGVAGIGKTVSVQKFILDWAEGKENQDVQLIFPLPFREINLMKDKTLSLSDLLHVFFPETKEMEISSDKYKVLFIFDGLDECRLSLDFQSDVRLCDVSESASVDVLLMNLIAGNLLPSALIWITSRPAAADLVPSECVHRVTEVRGFSDQQKEEYFRKRISDQSLANTIITHLKSSRSLYIMCHIPVFCWISATVLEKMLSEAESGEIPKTLTQMYTHFLILQTNIKHEKDYEKNVKDEDMILKLGKVAFQQLVKGNVIFYEEDLRECGIDVTEASVYSGLCTQIFRAEFGWYQGKVFCFVHLSVEEHLAALYVHLSYTNNNINVFEPITKQSLLSKVKERFKHVSLSELHQRAVNEALQSKNGHLDLFLRFLLGLSVESHQILLQGLMKQRSSRSDSNKKTVEYITKKIRTIDSPEKSINLFHCLNELGDHSLVEEIQHYLKSGRLKEAKLSSSQWSAVVFVLLTSEKKLDEFDLTKFILGNNKAEDMKVFQKLLPVIKESRSVQLVDCGVTDEGCAALTSALRSNPSHLRELNLTGNKIGNSVNLLSDVLQDPHCKLEKVWLSDCGVTDKGWAALTSALRSNPSHLRDLNLSGNEIGKSVNLLSDVLQDPHCKLEKLWLSYCGITDEGCAALTSALRSNPSHLRELDLSWNEIGNSVNLLSDVLQDPHCKLEKLWLSYCDITDEGCAALTSALRSNPSHLRELDLSENIIGESVNLLSDVLQDPHCKLEKLWLRYCGVTNEGCAALTSALRSNPSHLRELSLSLNEIGNSVNLLSDILQDPHCKLEKLWLKDCGITDEGCAALTSALRSNPSHLRELDLSWNEIGNSVNLLSDVLQDPHCKLEKLWLSYCDITDEGCAALTSALRSNPSHLRELDLSENIIGESVNLLSDVLQDPHCKLEKLWLRYCGVTDEGCAALTSALRSNPSHLRELNLSLNEIGNSVNLLSDILQDPHCKLEKLWLRDCGVTDEGCAALTSALRSNPSHLRQLSLSLNKIGKSVNLLSDVLQDPHCKLEILWLWDCGVTDKGCAALTSALRSNPSHLRVLDLSENKIGESVNLLSDVLQDPHCKLEKLWLRYCGVTDEGCAALTSALRSNPSHLRDLDLSGNEIGNSVNLLSDVLQDPHCKLEILWLRYCGVTDKGCAALTSALRSNPSHLRELNLTGNEIGKSVNLLSDVLQDPHCKLEILWLKDCGVTDKGCAALASALRSNPSHLRELSLTRNKIGKSVNLLSDVLQDPHCKLEKLCLRYCGVTDKGCAALTSALRSNPSHLRELDLSGNKIGESVNLLSDVLQDPHCKLEKLWLRDCGVTDEGCAALTSALRSNPSHLRELNLSGNKIGKSVNLLSDVLQDPHCKLEKLWLRYCGVTDEGCAALTSALRSNPSHLRELDLSGNKIENSVNLLSAVLQDPHCKLEKLWLRYCGVTDEGCAALTSALRSNPSHLRVLNLSGNKIGNSVNLLSDVLQDPHCKLEKLWLSNCGVTDEGCAALTSALRSNPSHLRDLDLSENKIGKSVNLLSDVLQDPYCKLERLWLSDCGVTDEGCAALASALRSNPSHLRELSLSVNKIGNSVSLLFDVLQDPHCKLETLWLRDCGVTDEGCAALTSALRSNPSHLRELNLSLNKIGNSVSLLSDVLQDPHCKLEKLWLRDCGVTDEGCAALASALRSNPSHLRELSLSLNKIGNSVSLLSDVLQDPHCKLDKLGLRDCGVTDEGCAALTSALRSNPSHLRELSLSWNKIGKSVNLLSDVLQDPHCKLEKLCLRYCGVTDEGFAALTSALRSNPSHLRELNLSGNKIGNSVNLLSDVLQDPHCKLEKLWLSDCGVTDEGCAALTSALRSNPSHLRELDLSGNKIGKSVNLLSDVLQDPHCKLEKLWLSDCGVTDEGCAALTSALRSNPSHLRELSLSENKIGKSVNLLSDVLQDPHCKLEKLELSDCGVTDEGCAALTSALRSNPSHLRELDLNWNKIGNSVNMLSDVLQDPHCKLEKLWLSNCGVTDEGCAALASALRSNPSHLRELNLTENMIGKSVNLLSDVLQDPHCKLEKLWLRDCGVTDEGCAALASALRSNPSHLRELDLSWNKLGSSGVTLLCAALKNPHCKLKILWLWECGVTDEGCAALASLLRSNPSHLRELVLSWNNLRDLGMKLLCTGLEDPHCKLEKLWLRDCGVTDKGCAALASALKLNPSHLRHLNLSENNLGSSEVQLLFDLKDDPHYKLQELYY
ncbi:protein NLRC5-like [Ctenopharyngodon idella]|uniref:protein NLRC5-like n=1 Tax=Ctenopharyngodon idella TaxID=7959 RepID=UPI00222FE795|nr:protein NLRC5-like [Ctenopharyngodon idella]